MNIHALSCTSAQSNGASRHSVLNNDAPPGIEQDTWDKANPNERRSLIRESEQQAWVAQTLPQIAEPLPLSMPNLPQSSAAGTGAPSIRDLIGALSTFVPMADRGTPKIIEVPPPYTVAPGDTLSKIAKKAEVTVDALRKANGLDPANDHRLRVGTQLRLPEGAKDISSIASTPINLQNKAWQTALSYTQGNIAGLDDKHTRALIASTVETESKGGDLGIVNSAGYLGRYQAGASWLAQAGLIKGGSDAVKKARTAAGFTRDWAWGVSGGMTKFLKNKDNWNNGLSYEKYLASAEEQDKAFKTNAENLYKTLVKTEHINAKTTQAEIAGLLKAGHIGGPNGALAVAKGGNGIADSNGTTPRKYYDDLVKRGDVYLKREIATPEQQAPSPTEQPNGMEPSAPLVADKDSASTEKPMTKEAHSHIGNTEQ